MCIHVYGVSYYKISCNCFRFLYFKIIRVIKKINMKNTTTLDYNQNNSTKHKINNITVADTV